MKRGKDITVAFLVLDALLYLLMLGATVGAPTVAGRAAFAAAAVVFAVGIDANIRRLLGVREPKPPDDDDPDVKQEPKWK